MSSSSLKRPSAPRIVAITISHSSNVGAPIADASKTILSLEVRAGHSQEFHPEIEDRGVVMPRLF